MGRIRGIALKDLAVDCVVANKLSFSPRIVIYPEEGTWLARSIDFDLLGDGPTRSEAVERLGEAIRIQLLASLKYRNLRNLFPPLIR